MRSPYQAYKSPFGPQYVEFWFVGWMDGRMKGGRARSGWLRGIAGCNGGIAVAIP